MWIIPALAGAIIALGVREWIEWFERRAEKMKNCVHDFYETTYAGYTTRHCRKCPRQEPGDNDGIKHP